MPDAPNILYLVLDSTRFDSYCLAHTPNFDKIGQPVARQALGGATDQVFFSLFTGRLPGPEILQIPELGLGGDTIGALRRSMEHADSVPLPQLLQDKGYYTWLLAAAPPIHRSPVLQEGFGSFGPYQWCEEHARLFELQPVEPWFVVMNWFEAHQPYRNQAGEGPDLDEYKSFWAERKKLRKAWQGAPYEPINRQAEPGELDAKTAAYLRELHRWQVKQVEHMDSVFGTMLPHIPKNTRVWIMADHGQCFGEFGHHGHDLNLPPIMTIPYVTGQI